MPTSGYGLAYNVMILMSTDLKKFYMPIYIHSQVQCWKISKNLVKSSHCDSSLFVMAAFC